MLVFGMLVCRDPQHWAAVCFVKRPRWGERWCSWSLLPACSTLVREPLSALPDDAEPDASTEGTHIAVVGENGFKKDTEGGTIYYARGGRGYIIVSSLGSDCFLVYDRQPPHSYVKTFQI